MDKQYAKYIQIGFDNISALKEISKNRHPELSDIVHERLVSKFSEFEALIQFIYWGIEVYLREKQEFTDENALALIDAGRVVLQRQGLKVIMDESKIASIYTKT